MEIRRFILPAATAILAATGQAPAEVPPGNAFAETCAAAAGDGRRVVCADVAALDQTLVYNRFGSFNPFGMIFALNRDIAPLPVAEPVDGIVDLSATEPLTAAQCALQLGTETRAPGSELSAGNVRLRDCKRPRPMVLRVNVGDILLVHVTNLLMPAGSPDFSSDFCDAGVTADHGRASVRDAAAEGDDLLVAHGEADCRTGPPAEEPAEGAAEAAAPDWPETRHVNFVVQGLAPLPMPDGTAAHPACFGTGAVDPDQDFYCRYEVLEEGTYFFASLAAPAGGEGNGGSLVHGLFGAILAEKPGSRWYRSQVTQAGLDAAWPATGTLPNRARPGSPGYEATDAAGVPILNMARPLSGEAQSAFASAGVVEIVHSDLNAIIYCDSAATGQNCAPQTASQAAGATSEPHYNSFREFSVFFHDELKAFYTRNFRELADLGQLAGVKDGFAINYGASGMGSLLLANRKGIGPADDCMECLYEEFFLTSWANGDPALLEWYPDDPSNVHHSYLNDPVVFRNFHAGPKETHVFHLHAHQWFAGNDPNRGAYLDSQTVAPQQGFTYNIYHGGLRNNGGPGGGWWDSQGSGNRNRTLGDSIFHCHLYPHFAQGMWALWRVHDVLEDGSRVLPDGQAHAGLSVDFTPAAERAAKRAGSVDPLSGQWLATQEGTPVPAIVPLPGEPIPLAPTYAEAADIDMATGALRDDAPTPMPGYPFYIAGETGHRPPQAPLDIARNLGAPAPADAELDDRGAPSGAFAAAGDWLDGGLNRHVVESGSEREFGILLPAVVTDPAQFAALSPDEQVLAMRQVIAKAFALGDLSGHLTRARIRLLDPFGERLERAAMGFHHDGKLFRPGSSDSLRLVAADGDPVTAFGPGGYETEVAAAPGAVVARDPVFAVNGSAPRPGAPFADPCAGWNGAAAPQDDPLTAGWLNLPLALDPSVAGFRRYEASAVQLDLIVNRAGWHDPQARINVLTGDSGRFKTGPGLISPLISDSEEPFFFRALSGECIEYRHTNELPKELELDDFQVRTPTDTIGQHIHLVKFDVTASDGSGNGWNYEDGTFAADELTGRLCAWAETGDPQAMAIVAGLADKVRAQMTPEELAGFPSGMAYCDWPVVTEHNIWRLERSRFPFLFQTTTQRWFADPILSPDETGKAIDRTLRTVFTHDHFGPSSIQQHGFYAALVIEPPARYDGASKAPEICDVDALDACVGPLAEAVAGTSVAWGGEIWAGTRKIVRLAQDDPFHPNFREFALSIADFALLYDPRDQEDARALARAIRGTSGTAIAAFGELEGMAKIACEARHRLSPLILRDVCGTEPAPSAGGGYVFEPTPPAWMAGGANRDDAHTSLYAGDFFALPGGTKEHRDLLGHMIGYRQKAAGTFDPGLPVLSASGRPQAGAMASPVAAPERPEAISVDHHDPYLVSYRGAPVPLRIADKDNDKDADGEGVLSADCAPLAMNRPGEHGASEVVTALATGDFGQCSRVFQIAGALGDIAGAFHSRLHGDPETPVLEAFSGERLVFRMIQGAQEVQHTFVLTGQPFKRNLDQAFPQGMRPLAMAGAPTLQDLCAQRQEVEASHPGQYRQWLDTAPANRGASFPDLAHWLAYETALAECDNLEGFAFAQEIGISEHFEMQGSLRSDVGASVEFAPEVQASLSADGTRPEDSSDYFYSFGTIDAMWNGAWGLVRIYRDGETLDPATVPDWNSDVAGPAVPIGNRLPVRAEGTESVSLAAMPGGSGLACPIPGDGETQRVVDAVIVAFETRKVFDPAGTVYAPGVTDPDGLMLALLAPEQLGIADIGDDAAFQALSAAAVADAVQDAYAAHPEPFLLRVTAGDCLRLRLVNLMGDPGGTMRDVLGDAMLPRIVPLNADPVPRPSEGPIEELELQPFAAGVPQGGLRPSPRLALSLGLPGLDLLTDVPLGFGYQAEALAGGNGGVSVGPVLAAYAGRFRIDDTTPANLPLSDHIANIAAGKLETIIAAAPEGYFNALTPAAAPEVSVEVAALPDAGRDEGAGRALGYEFGLTIFTENPASGAEFMGDAAALAPVVAALCPDDACPAGAETLAGELKGALRLALLQTTDDMTHWIPYAFGPVPVKPTADTISQPGHGLFGMIDVLPATWAAVGDDGLDCDAAPVNGYLRCSARHLPGKGADRGATYLASGGATPLAVREFVLFYQDGLNHWDANSTLDVVWADSGLPVTDDALGAAKIVPDCPICDDSYDRGERGVSYASPPLSRALRDLLGADIAESDDLNAFVFPKDFAVASVGQPRLKACVGEQIVIRVIHPGGRARQRAFAMNGYSYHDLFPGFGFPRATLLAPGKTMTAWLSPLAREGTVVWHDGPTHLRAGGTWGTIDVAAKGEAGCPP